MRLLSRSFRRRNDFQNIGGKVNIGREKRLANHIPDKSLVSGYIKNSYDSIRRQTT